MSAIGFDYALEKVPQRRLTDESDLLSQFYVSRERICELGLHRDTFEKTAPEIWGSGLTENELDVLWTLDYECSKFVRPSSETQKKKKKRATWTYRRRKLQPQKVQVEMQMEPRKVMVASMQQYETDCEWQ